MIVIIIFLGLSCKLYLSRILSDVSDVLGDALWGLMIFYIIRGCFLKWSVLKVAMVSVLICFLVEGSQLYHGDYVDQIRHTFLGKLVLGSTFAWRDLFSYLLGNSIGIFLEKRIKRPSN